jgi:hypothetical protein
MSTNTDFDFRLTTSCVVDRLIERFGVSRSAETSRAWGRMGKLPVLELENGQRLFRGCDVDELGARLAADANLHVA